jgi:membrane associated rhomboid family serine protease
VRTGRFGAPGSFGFSLDLTPTVRRLLIANFAVWILQLIFRQSGSVFFENMFALNPATVLPWRPWQIVTYMFLHGPGAWLLCGVAGGLLQLMPPFRAPTVGASGAVLGVLTAFAVFYPDARMLLFFFIPVSARVVVIFYAVLSLMSAASSSGDGIAHMAHLGGIAAGYFMLRGVPFVGRFRRDWGVHRDAQRRREREELRDKLDEVLDKMNRVGEDGLTQDDWNTLLDASRKRRDE